MALTTKDHCRVTVESVARAFAHHQTTGKIKSWHNWHEDKPSRKRPMFTVTVGSGEVLDIATLWEARALCYGLSQTGRSGNY